MWAEIKKCGTMHFVVFLWQAKTRIFKKGFGKFIYVLEISLILSQPLVNQSPYHLSRFVTSARELSSNPAAL